MHARPYFVFIQEPKYFIPILSAFRTSNHYGVQMAGMSDIPQIDIVLNNMPERGVIGIGEPPTVSTASAIANAVRNATGVTIRSLPLHPHKVLAAIEQQRAGGTA